MKTDDLQARLAEWVAGMDETGVRNLREALLQAFRKTPASKTELRGACDRAIAWLDWALKEEA